MKGGSLCKFPDPFCAQKQMTCIISWLAQLLKKIHLPNDILGFRASLSKISQLLRF